MQLTRSLFLLICLSLLGGPETSWAQIPSRDERMTVLRYGESAEPEALWTVGPILSLGDEAHDSPQLFWNVAGVMSIANGGLVVGDGGSSELRFFDRATGEHIRTVGGEGPGPGEIDGLWNMWRAADAIVTVDASGWASYFDERGTFLRRVPPPVSALGLRLRRAGFFSDGSALAFGVEPDADVPPNGETTISMRIVTLVGDEPRFVMRYPHHIATRKGRARPWGLVFGPVSALVATADGFCVGFPQEYVIDCFSRNRRPLYRIVRESWARVPVTHRDRRDYFAVNEAANPHGFMRPD